MKVRPIALWMAAGLLGVSAASGQTEPAPDVSDVAVPQHAPAAGENNDTGGLMDRAAANGAQVYVDDSFASVEKIRNAAKLATQGQPQLAINAYQDIIDKYGQKLVYLKSDTYVSITDYVREKLLAMPEVKSGMYDQIYGREAQKQVNAAIDAHDVATLIRTCDRYFCATAAEKGLSQAAEWYFERGEFAAAARTWQLLLKHPAAKELQAELLFRAATADSLAGDKTDAKTLRARLARDFPDAMGTVAGEQVKLLAKLDDVMQLSAAPDATLPVDEWPAFGGGPSRSELPTVNSSIGARLWGVSLTDPAVAGENRPNLNAQRTGVRQIEQADSNLQSLLSHPILSNGMLYLHTGERVVALSANAGTVLWKYPENVIVDPMQAQQLANYGANYRPEAHESAAVYGDQVFAILPAERKVDEGETNPYGALMPSTRVVCLNRNDGKELWATSGQDVKTESRGRLMFLGSPLVTRAGVFVMARKAGDASFNQLYLVRLDRDTGAATWSCYLCSASTGAYYGPFMNFSNIPIPTLVDDIVYISSGQGADCAVDANAGRILWLQITDAAKVRRNPQEYYNPQFTFTPSWKFNPPLVHGEKLVCFDTGSQGSVMHVYNRFTGKLLATLSKENAFGDNGYDVTAGIIGSKLLLVGSNVAAFDLDTIDQTKTPMASWVVEFPSGDETGKLQGRPFLSTTGLYVPFDKGLALVNPGSGAGAGESQGTSGVVMGKGQGGKLVDFWLWPRTENDVSGQPGNLLVTSEQVVVVNDTEIAGYSRWETARDNRLAKIKEHPDDPVPYLALAEISFRTNHIELAQDNMKSAVSLANASTESVERTTMLERLYLTNLNFAEQLLAKPDDDVRDKSRFFFEQCKLTARTPEQQAEWRLSLSDLSLAQKKPEEAAGLYNEVLTDPALRSAPYHHGESLSRASVSAEQKFRTLIEKNGADVYKRFEDQAVAILGTARQQQNPASLQQVVDAYPNSKAAIDAAGDLATAYREKQDWLAQLKVLRWIYPRAEDAKKPEVTAELSLANLQLKRFGAAVAWADRGQRQFKDASWTDAETHQAMTFSGLKDKLKGMGAGGADARRPVLPGPQPDAPGGMSRPMDESSLTDALSAGRLLLPLEDSPALRRPDLLFIQRGKSLRIYDVDASAAGGSRKTVELPQNAPAILVGFYGDIAVLAQARGAVAIDVKKGTVAWSQSLSLSQSEMDQQAEMLQRIQNLQNQVQVNGPNVAVQVVVNGPVQLDANGNAIQAPADPDAVRQMAFSQLGRVGFSLMRMGNGKLYVVSGSVLKAFDLATGKPAWQEGGATHNVHLPEGLVTALLPTDDSVVAQITSGAHNDTSFYVVEADTGKFRKQIKLADERVAWRTISDDGTLFAVTDKAVEAYDLFADTESPLWRRADIITRYAGATALTLDGLLVVSSSEELSCLSLEGGEARWPVAGQPPIRLVIAADHAQPSFIRSAVDGDMVVYQTDQGIASYLSYPQSVDDGQLAWNATINRESTPPLNAFQLSDPYVILFATGPMLGAQHAVQFVFINHKGGRRTVTKTIEQTAGDPEGPVIQHWQVLDNGIAMESNGSVYFYHAKEK